MEYWFSVPFSKFWEIQPNTLIAQRYDDNWKTVNALRILYLKDFGGWNVA